VTPGLPVTVRQATPSLTWANPADITSGTPLGKTQLDATASVPGTFSYSPAAGTILSPGQGQVLSVTFTPTDTTDYTTVSARATVNVLEPTAKASPVIIGEQAVFRRKMKDGKPAGNPVLVGYTIAFSSKLTAASADLATNYEVDAVSTKSVKKKRVSVVQRLTDFTVSYNDASESVRLTFTARPTFKTGGQITVKGGPSSGVTGVSGAFVSGNRVLTISRGGKKITPA
jgi:hypothetical protein